MVGNGVRSAGAAHLVIDFAKKTNIPVLTTMNGVDLAQDDLHLGFIGTHGNRIANMIINECDLVISVGARLGIRQVGRDASKFAPNANLVRCDIDEYELSRNIKDNESKHQSDAKDFLNLLLKEEIPDYSEWRNCCLEAKALLSDHDKQPGNIAVETIASLLPANPNVSVDVGMNQCYCAQSLVLKGYEGRIHISGGYGTMGCALPFAIGSCYAIGKQPVYCISGDGGFQMNIQELETVHRDNLPIKMFVLNNKVLGKISETQTKEHDGRLAATASSGGYAVPNFVSIAEAYGIRSTVCPFNELSLYQDWLVDQEACLIEIPLPEDAYLMPKINFNTGIISPPLDYYVEKQVKEILTK